MLISFVLNIGAELVGKKWRAAVMWYLKDGPLRFSQLKTLMPLVSVKVLSEVLKEMEENQLIVRKQYPTIPVKVTYEIHPDALDFVEANSVCMIRIAEYILKNSKRLNVDPHVREELEKWTAKNQVYIHLCTGLITQTKNPL